MRDSRRHVEDNVFLVGAGHVLGECGGGGGEG